MSIDVRQSENHALIQLSEAIVIGSATELQRALVEALSSSPSVAIDLGDVTEIDVSAIQLLYAAWKAAERAGVALTLAGTAPATVKSAFLETGLDPFQLISGQGLIS